MGVLSVGKSASGQVIHNSINTYPGCRDIERRGVDSLVPVYASGWGGLL